MLSYPDYATYHVPKKNVFVLSCIDLRLTDELVKFLHFDNLANRYDHFTLAGTSLCTCVASTKEYFKEKIMEDYDNFILWERTFYEHLQIAIDLHDIQDVYIIEHEDCGAYKAFLEDGVFVNSEKELAAHSKFAKALAKEIAKRSFYRNKETTVKHKLNVHAFYIDLRGSVQLIKTYPHQ